MKKLLIILALCVGAYAQAKDNAKLAYCTTGTGCTFCQSAYSEKEVDNMLNYLGTYSDRGGIMTFFKNNSGVPTHYPERKRTPKELHQYFGGKGEPSTANNCLIPYPGIQPADGNWAIETSTPETANCPKGTAEQLASLKMFDSGPKTFSKPFTPYDLLSVNEVKWISLGWNEYRGVFSGAIGNFDTMYDVTVVSPTSMKGTLHFEIRIPGQPVCKVRKGFEYTRRN